MLQHIVTGVCKNAQSLIQLRTDENNASQYLKGADEKGSLQFLMNPGESVEFIHDRRNAAS